MTNFDPNIPYNDLALLPPKQEFYNLATYKKVVKATDELSKLNGLLLSTWDNVTATMNMFNPFFAPEAEASSKVENIVTTTEEILLAGVLDESQQSPAQKEGRAYVNALAKGASIIESKKPLTTNSFLDIQDKLAVKAKGIRKTPGTQLKDDRTGKVFYTPPEGESRIRDLLQNLENFINIPNDEIDPLINMALMHYQFEAIHPFYDGNGRTGRILMPLYLELSHKTRYPFLFISGYILKHKPEYYSKLRNVTEKGEWLQWVDFILEGATATAKRMSDTLIQIKEQKDQASSLLGENIGTRHNDLVQFVFNEPIFNRLQLADSLGIHNHTSTKYAEYLVETKIVTKQKFHKQWVYINVGLVRLLQKYAQWD